MSLVGNFGGGSGGSTRGGARILKQATSNQKPASEVMEEARVAQRLNLLSTQLPDLASSSETLLLDLARQQTDDDVMMSSAIGALSAVQVENMLKEVRGWSKEQQIGMAAEMNPIKKDALVRNGWQIPVDEKKSGGLFGRVMNTLAINPFTLPLVDRDKGFVGGGAAGAVAKKGAQAAGWGMKLPVIREGLAAMDWAAEETSRPGRVAPLMQSGKDLLEETGMSAEQLEAQTGIKTYASQGDIGAMNQASLIPGVGEGLNLAAAFASHPSDLWKAAQTWNEIGHEGDDDILPQVQYQVYNDLESAWKGNGKDMLRWAKGIAAGESLEDLAESEGLEGEQAMQFVQQVGLYKESATFKAAVAKLTGGQVSVGRTLARRVYDNPTMDTSEGAARYISGSADAMFSIVADPTIVAGKISKTTKVIRWGIKAGESSEKLDRWQKMSKILLTAEEEGEDAAHALRHAKELGEIAGGSKFLTGAVTEAEAVTRPAVAISEALRTGNVGSLMSRYPGLMKSWDDMQRYNTALKEMGEKGMDEDPSQVFEFYKEASRHRNLVNTAGPIDSLKFNTKLFGHDGGGHLIMPHTTGTQRAGLALKESMKRVSFGKLDEIPADALAEMKASDDQAAAELAEQAGATQEEIAEAAARMEVDKWTGAYEKKKSNRVQDALFHLYTLGAKKVNREGFAALEGASSLEDFSALTHSLGLLEGASAFAVRERINRFATGNTMQRHMLANEVFLKMYDAANLSATQEGRDLFKKYVEHSNHIYGIHDAVSIARGGVHDTKRLIIKQAVIEGQLAEGVSIPSMREMVIAARKSGSLRRLTGTIRKSQLEAAMTQIWKPLQLVRMAFPLRSGADEAIQEMGRNGAHGYLKAAVFEKWAGVQSFTRNADGQLVGVSGGAVKPLRTFTRYWANIADGTDTAIERKVRQRLTEDPKFIAATADEQAAWVARESAPMGRKGGRKNLSFVPRTMRTFDEWAHLSALRSSQAIHALTGQKNVTRHQWREALLGIDEETIRNRKILSTDAMVQRERAEIIGTSINGLRYGDSNNGVPEMVRMKTGTSESGYQYLPVITDRGEYQWVGHEDLTGMYLNMSHWMEKMAKPANSSRAAIEELAHLVPKTVLDEVGSSFGVNGLDGLRQVRDRVAEDSVVRGHLAHAVSSEADAASIRASLAANDVEDLSQYEDILAAWDSLSPEAKRFISDDRLFTQRLTTDLAVAQNRAANGVYNSLRRLDNQGNLRSLIRAQVIDGKVVAEPLKRHHTRIYAPMFDRRSAEDVVRLFQDPDMATSFAERLQFHLQERNLFGEMRHVWDGAPPHTGGYDLATWMAGIKGTLVQGEGSYVSAMMAGSSNYALAEAMRDALADVIPEQMLKPTVGYYDYANDLMDRPGGIKRLSDSTVAMEPHHAVKMTPIDPESVVRQVHVRKADGTEMWLGEEELGTLGRVASMDRVKAVPVNKAKRMLDTGKGKVRFHPKLVDADFKAGMKFLNGQGGDYSLTKAPWTWADGEYAGKADELQDILDELGLAENTGLDLGELIGLYKARTDTAPLPLEGAMRDNDLWDDFEELARTANKTGPRTTETWSDAATRTQSQIAKAALDELGIDVNSLGLTRSQYKSLLIEREKAHVGLDPAGFGRPTTVSKAAIEREKDALAVAFQRAEIDTPVSEALRERLTVALNKEKDDYRILGEIYGTGTVEDAAVRTAAQTILEDVNKVFIGAKSGEPLHGVIGPLLRGEFEMDDLIRKVDINDLPAKGGFGPTRVIADENFLNRGLRRYFEGSVQPIVSAISRTPMFNKSFDKAMANSRGIYDTIVHRGVDTEAKAVLAKINVDPDDLDDVHDLLWRQLRQEPKFGEGAADPITDYARKLKDEDFDGAKEALSKVLGRPVDLSEDELRTLGRWHANLATARDVQVEYAMKRATEMVTPYVDDHKLRSNLQEFLGPFFIPFYYAEEQFLRRFARGIYETPYMLRKGQLVMNGLRNMGIVRDPDGHGEVIVIPGSEVLTGAVADVATMLTGNEAFQMLEQPLQMRTEFVLPGWGTEQSRWGWGPVIGLAGEGLLRRFPEAEWRKEPPSRSWWQYVVPGPISGAYKAFIQDPDPAQTASMQMSAIGYLEANGHGLPEDATAVEREQYLEDLRQVTRVGGVLRFLSGQLTFTSMTPVDTEAIFRKEFRDLLGDGLEYGDALDLFIAQHGPENLVEKIFKHEEGSILEAIKNNEGPLLTLDTSQFSEEERKQFEQARRENIARTLGATQNQTGAPLPMGEQALRFMYDNEELLRNDPESAVWLMPQEETDGEFDRRAWNEQLALKLRTKKAPEEVLEKLYVAQASEGYFTMKDEYDSQRRNLVDARDAAPAGAARAALQAQIRDLDDRWTVKKGGYMAQHPVFADSFSPEAKERRQTAIENLRWQTAAGIGGEQGEVIGGLLDEYYAFLEGDGAEMMVGDDRVRNPGYTAVSGDTSTFGKELKTEILHRHFTRMWEYVQRNPKAAPFWNSVIRPELPDQADTIETKLTQGA